MNQARSDAALIANAPADLRYLLDKVKRLEGELYVYHNDDSGPCKCDACQSIRREKEPTRAD